MERDPNNVNFSMIVIAKTEQQQFVMEYRIILIIYMKKEESSKITIDKLITNFIGYSQSHDHLLTKYNDSFYLNYFDRLKIDESVKKIQSHQEQLGTIEFVRLFLSVINHTQQQTLYLCISLIKLYKKIKEDTNNDKGVKFADFTNFLCNKISEADPDLVIPMKEIPIERNIPDASQIRDIDIHPPLILNKIQIQRPKIVKDKNKKEKKLDEKKPVSKLIVSSTLNCIIALGRLSSSISLYEPNQLKKIQKIIPSACKTMSKDVAILSMAFSERDKRIGCIINNIGITFWEATDNFTTEKVLGSNKSDHDPKAYGDKIYFFNLFNEWATTDKNTIYFWNLKDEIISRTIHKQKMSSINDICEIKHIRCLLVAYTTEGPPQKKLLILYQGQKQVSKLNLQNSGCHTLLYNESTQLIIMLGYSNLVSVLQIDVQTFDINIVGELKAHNSILSCVCNIPTTSMIISGDDIGNVKLWDLNYMRCLEGEKIAKNLHQIICHDNKLVYADSRINVVLMEHSGSSGAESSIYPSKCDEEVYGIYQFFRKEDETLWVITRKDARKISLKNGRTTERFVLCNSEEEISAAGELYNGFVIGTSKGELSKYGLNGSQKWKISAHDSEINTIKIDMENHLIGTLGGDNNMILWSEKAILDKENNVRKKITFKGKDINLFEVCPYSNLILISSTNDKVLQFWNYDTLKLIQTIEMPSFISSFIILPDKALIIVSSVQGLYVIYYYRKENKLFTECLFKIDEIAKIDHSDYSQFTSRSSQDDDKKLYISSLAYCEDKNILIAASSKGMMYNFSFENWPSNENYRRQYEGSPAIKRYTKESYEHEILKNKYSQCQIVTIMKPSSFNLSVLWSMKIHKDNLIGISVLNLQKKYLSSLCLDGYCKFIQLQYHTGKIACSLKLNFPLPNKWQLEIEDYCDLKSIMHEALSIIDSIIKNYGYDLSIKEQIYLNITPFLEVLFQTKYELNKSKLDPELMSSYFSEADVNGTLVNTDTSLKSMQAYKRLQLIKKQNEQSFDKQNHEETSHYETSSIEKQFIRQYLSPNYLPKLLGRISDEPEYPKTDDKGYNLLQKLEEGFNKRQHKKTKEMQRQYKMSSSNSKGSEIMTGGSKSMLNKSSLGRSSTTLKDKSVCQILSQIDSKLTKHKKNKNKIFKLI